MGATAKGPYRRTQRQPLALVPGNPVLMLVLALSFSFVITLIAALDQTQGGYFPVSQQPLADLRIVMAGREGRSPE